MTRLTLAPHRNVDREVSRLRETLFPILPSIDARPWVWDAEPAFQGQRNDEPDESRAVAAVSFRIIEPGSNVTNSLRSALPSAFRTIVSSSVTSPFDSPYYVIELLTRLIPFKVVERSVGGIVSHSLRATNCAVDEGHAGAEDGCGQNPRAVRCDGLHARTSEYGAFVARSSGDDTHNPFSVNAPVPVSRPVLPGPISAIQNRNWKSQLKPACKSAFEGPHVPHTPALQFEGGLHACDFVGARTVKDELAHLEVFGQ